MADGTGIEWTDATWNPVRGCSRVSEGCRNCYAERVAARFSGPGEPYEGLIRFRSRVSGLMYDSRGAAGDAEALWNGKVRLVERALDQPLRWKRPRKIFVNSMSDLFHENLPLDDVLRVFEVMHKAKHHTFQVLTKRPQRVLDFVRTYGLAPVGPNGETQSGSAWPSNVWMGVSVENQAAADERIPLLLQTPAVVRFLSCEPLLGPVDLLFAAYDGSESFGHVPALHWVIAGGESGPGARPMHPAWARSLRDQCAAAKVPFFFKQHGDWAPHCSVYGEDDIDVFSIPDDCVAVGLNGARYDDASQPPPEQDPWWMQRVGKRAAGSLLDGVVHQAFPVTT